MIPTIDERLCALLQLHLPVNMKVERCQLVPGPGTDDWHVTGIMSWTDSAIKPKHFRCHVEMEQDVEKWAGLMGGCIVHALRAALTHPEQWLR